jgi:hypothetical protein
MSYTPSHRRATFNQRKLGMERIKEEIILSPRGDEAGYSQDRRSILLNPSVTEGAGCTYVFRIPVRHLGDSDSLDHHLVWNINSNDSVILRWLGKIRMNQHF